MPNRRHGLFQSDRDQARIHGAAKALVESRSEKNFPRNPYKEVIDTRIEKWTVMGIMNICREFI
jgi:hypothetical protein